VPMSSIRVRGFVRLLKNCKSQPEGLVSVEICTDEFL
jgi:hypothetical protein